MYLDITPQGELANISIGLLNDIVSVNNYHLSTGIIGTKCILDVDLFVRLLVLDLMQALTQIGRTDVGLLLAQQGSYPGWGYMILQQLEASATTVW
jgi:hypothetical protein